MKGILVLAQEISSASVNAEQTDDVRLRSEAIYGALAPDSGYLPEVPKRFSSPRGKAMPLTPGNGCRLCSGFHALSALMGLANRCGV